MKTLLTILLTIIAWEWFKKKTKLSWYAESGYFVLFFFGTALMVRDIEKHPSRFSERNGYDKYKQIGKWRITKIVRV